MNIKDLSKVENLKGQLKSAVSVYRLLMSLTNKNSRLHGFNSRAYLTLGGDCYGNGSISSADILINESPELIRICRKKQSAAWGKVVSLRADIRLLGVELDGEY